MGLNRNRLYILIISSCLAGYTWLLIVSGINSNSSQEIGVCIIKHVTNIPCPSCGSTRSVLSLLKGNFTDALLSNPIGYLLAVIMIAAPFWILFDYLKKKETLFNFYNKIESAFKRKKIAIPSIFLILLNWVWNIYKDI
jgi:hypothetical protein